MAVHVDVLWQDERGPVPWDILEKALTSDAAAHFRGDGTVTFWADPAMENRLICTRMDGHGFSVIFYRDASADPRQRYMISVADPEGMADPVFHPIESVRPAGSFVPGEAVLQILRDFETDSAGLSSAISWMPYDEVPEAARFAI